jgi:hypothetical protein
MLVRRPVSFVMEPPAAQLPWGDTGSTRQRYLRWRRVKAFRQREEDANKSKGKRRCYRVYMWDADVIALLDDWEPPQQRDDQLTPRELHEHFDQQWIKEAEGVIEQAALLAIKKNRK